MSIFLRQIGAENAIVRLKKADIGATEAFYWRLRGALEIVIVSFILRKKRRKGLINLMKYFLQMDLGVVNGL